MGTGASKASLAKTHGPTAKMGELGENGVCGRAGEHTGYVRRVSSARSPNRGAAVGVKGGGYSGGRQLVQHACQSPLGLDEEAANPLGEDSLDQDDRENGKVSYARVDAILGSPGSTAKYILKRSIGKGAYGEAYIVERNAAYNPQSCPLAERQVSSNKLAHPTRVGCTYVVKIMDLRNMRQQDRQYAQTEIICIAHTHHFAIIKYYEHYVFDSVDETMMIVTEFADHGDLARNLSRGRDTRYTDGAVAHSAVQTLMSSTSPLGASAASERGCIGVEYATGFPTSQSGAVVGGNSGGGGFLSAHSSYPQSVLPHSSGATGPAMGALHLTEREAGMYFVQILAALRHIHVHRMIHRDVKSANLFLTSSGFIKIGDFGFSQKYESTVSSETIAGTFLGTPYYASPEMWKGTRYGKKADVWAAGIVLYEMLMDGQRPFKAMGLAELKRVVLETDVELPEYPPEAEQGAVAPSPGVEPPRRGKFSPEMRELVRSIFQKDPKLRPSTEELLRTPIMQHYLFLFQRHVQSLIESDARLRKENPSVSPMQLAFPDDADRELVLQGLDELNTMVAQEIRREVEEPGALRYEGVVYKGNRDGTWKERYLALEDDVLIISLSRSKSAAEGAERSRRVPIRMVKAVNKVQCSDPHVQPVGEPRSPSEARYVPPFTFVLFMAESSSPIYFGVATETEVNRWMEVMMRALHID